MAKTRDPAAEAARFSKDFRRLMKLVGDRADIVARQVCMSIGEGLVLASPVGNPTLWKHPAPKGYVGGRFRANWQYGFGAIPSGVIDAVDASGNATIGRMTSGIAANAGKAGTNYFANNLPYANRLEYGHHSTQTHAAGMVGLVILNFHQYVQDAVRQAKTAKAGA